MLTKYIIFFWSNNIYHLEEKAYNSYKNATYSFWLKEIICIVASDYSSWREVLLTKTSTS